MVVAFNQTNVELKSHKTIRYHVIRYSFNQTNVELKYGGKSRFICRMYF